MVKATTKGKTPAKGKAAAKAPAKTYTESDITIQPFADVYTGGATGDLLTDKQADVLRSLGFVTTGTAKEGSKWRAVATDAGRKWIEDNVELGEGEGDGAAGGETTGQAAGAVAPGGFTIRTDIAFPTGTRGVSTRQAKYPFADLPVHGSFHIAKTDDNPTPAKSFASTITAANKRHADDGRKFIIRSVGPEDPDGVGARIFRKE